MSRKIMGVTVGTPTSPKKIEDVLKPVKTVNGVAPDEDGNVVIEIPEVEIPEIDYSKIEEAMSAVQDHVDDKENPHGVTPEQIGAEKEGAASEVQENLTDHMEDKNNPHGVTAEQIGAATTEELSELTDSLGSVGETVSKNATDITELTRRVDLYSSTTLMYFDNNDRNIRDVFSRVESLEESGGVPGKDGKSAYQYAQESGYTGTEEAFADDINPNTIKALATPVKGVDYTDGKDGASIAVSSVNESTASGGSNVVTFSDGKTLTVKNGIDGKNGSDYIITDENKSEIADLVIAAMGGQPVFGYVDLYNDIIINAPLAEGVYHVFYEMEDGSKIQIGELDNGLVLCAVTKNATNCSILTEGDSTSVIKGSDFYAQIKANTGYELSTVKVTMGGTDITSTAIINSTDTVKEVSIYKVTGDIVITATAIVYNGDQITFTGGKIDTSTGAITSAENYAYSDMFAYDSSKTYTLSFVDCAVSWKMCYYDSSKNFLMCTSDAQYKVDLGTSNNPASGTFVLPKASDFGISPAYFRIRAYTKIINDRYTTSFEALNNGATLSIS